MTNDATQKIGETRKTKKSKHSQWQEVIKIRTETNAIETTKKLIQRIDQQLAPLKR